MCRPWGNHPVQDPGPPGTHSQLAKLHICLLIVQDQKQTNLAFTQASCLAEGRYCDGVNPSGAATVTLCRARLSSPATCVLGLS